MHVRVEATESGPWVLVRVYGELDMASAPTLRQELVTLVTAGSVHLALDLTDVDFVDSTGLGVLIGGLKRTRGNGGDLRLVAPNPGLQSILELTGLDAVFRPVAEAADLAADPS